MPKTGHRNMTKVIPPKNATIPLIRSGREKKRTVLEKPVFIFKMSRNGENVWKKVRMEDLFPFFATVSSFTILTNCKRQA